MRPFNAGGEVQQTIPQEDGKLRHLALRGAAATLLSGGMGLSIQIISAAALGRLLDPRDFGLVTIVLMFSTLFLNFGFNGFTESIVHREEINHRLVSNIFWMNVGGSAALTIMFASSGCLLAKFFHDPRIAGTALWMASTILLTGLSVVHLGLLKRAMRFSMVCANDVLARILSVSASICLAWSGWGYWALVAGWIVLAASTCIGAWVLCFWIPGRPGRASGTVAMIRYAISAYGHYCTGYFTNNLDNFLIGWKLGPASLGFYKKAYDLFGIPANQLASGMTIVSVSVLSRLSTDVERYKRYLLGAFGSLAFIGMGISGDLILVGRDLIYLLLGPKWGESGRLFTMFAPGIGISLLYGTQGWIHLSTGNANRWFRWGFVDMIVTTMFLLIGIRWQAEGIVLAWVASYWITTWPALWYAGKPIQLGLPSIIASIWRYIAASLLASSFAFSILRAVPSFIAISGPLGAMIRLVCVSLLFSVFYITALTGLFGGVAPLYRMAILLREMTSRKVTSSLIECKVTPQ